MKKHIENLENIRKKYILTEEESLLLEETKTFLENIKGMREVDLDNLKIKKMRFKSELIENIIYYNQQLLKSIAQKEVLINPNLQPDIEITEEMKNYVENMSVKDLLEKLIKSKEE